MSSQTSNLSLALSMKHEALSPPSSDNKQHKISCFITCNFNVNTVQATAEMSFIVFA